MNHTKSLPSSTMRRPDEDLPHKQVSLAEFLQIADGLLYEQKDVYKFIRFVLAGRYIGEGPMSRVFVNAKQGLHTGLPDGAVNVTRDYDSILGISKDLPYMSALAVYPLSPFKETLKKNNHMTSLGFDSHVSVSTIYGLLHSSEICCLGSTEAGTVPQGT